MVEDPRSLNLSWSQLRTFEECAQKGFLQRAGKRSAAGDLRTYFPGMVVDHIMDRWLADPAHPSGAMAAMVADAIGEVEREAIATGDGVVRWKQHLTDRDEVREFCVELVTRLEPILRDLVLPHRHLAHHRFRVPLRIPYLDGEPVIVHLVGEMDLLVGEDGEHVIWDLKGTRDDSYWRKVLGQLVFYDLADFVATSKRTRTVGLIQPMCKEPVLRWDLTDEHRAALHTRVIGLANNIWRGTRDCKKDTHGCNWCSVRHACVRYAPTDNPLETFGARLAGATPGGSS